MRAAQLPGSVRVATDSSVLGHAGQRAIPFEAARGGSGPSLHHTAPGPTSGPITDARQKSAGRWWPVKPALLKTVVAVRSGSVASRSVGALGWLARRSRGRRRVRPRSDCEHGRAGADFPAPICPPCPRDGGGRAPARRRCRSGFLARRSNGSRARHAPARFAELRARYARLELKRPELYWAELQRAVPQQMAPRRMVPPPPALARVLLPAAMTTAGLRTSMLLALLVPRVPLAVPIGATCPCGEHRSGVALAPVAADRAPARRCTRGPRPGSNAARDREPARAFV